ncbi:hypothetical protein HU200_044525 [Digitaria exilis]|uniref:Uncharacterized protein n=1 Tax=Digitaria exilis TaxID=1010633 RepID=A0A835BC60_9POAL|nr:hypothetical protein HU200_044525 [Digitaria exilis]
MNNGGERARKKKTLVCLYGVEILPDTAHRLNNLMETASSKKVGLPPPGVAVPVSLVSSSHQSAFTPPVLLAGSSRTVSWNQLRYSVGAYVERCPFSLTSLRWVSYSPWSSTHRTCARELASPSFPAVLASNPWLFPASFRRSFFCPFHALTGQASLFPLWLSHKYVYAHLVNFQGVSRFHFHSGVLAIAHRARFTPYKWTWTHGAPPGRQASIIWRTDCLPRLLSHSHRDGDTYGTTPGGNGTASRPRSLWPFLLPGESSNLPLWCPVDCGAEGTRLAWQYRRVKVNSMKAICPWCKITTDCTQVRRASSCRDCPMLCKLLPHRHTDRQQNIVCASGHVRTHRLLMSSPLATRRDHSSAATPPPGPAASARARARRHQAAQTASGISARRARPGCRRHRAPPQPNPIDDGESKRGRPAEHAPRLQCRVADPLDHPARSDEKMRVNADNAYPPIPLHSTSPPTGKPKSPEPPLTNQKKSTPARPLAVSPLPRRPHPQPQARRSSRFRRALPSSAHRLRPPPMGPPHAAQDHAPSPSGGSGSTRRRLRRLDRRNASKHIGYDASNFCEFPPPPQPPASAPASGPASLAHSAACSLDLVNSFRIGGSGDGGGDVQFLCQSLGLSGPDDFAIPLADWEAHKAVRSSASASTSPSSARHKPDPPARDSPLRHEGAEEEPTRPADAEREIPAKEPAVARSRCAPIEALERPARRDPLVLTPPDVKRAVGEGGIKGLRPPPVLKPPPSMALAALPAVCGTESTWDILRSFAPDEKEHAPASRSGRGFGYQDAVEEEHEDAVVALTLEDLKLGESSEGFTGTSSLSTTYDDETSSTTTESMFFISPNGRFRKKIRSWNRGVLLGSGSFGTVYEGISE